MFSSSRIRPDGVNRSDREPLVPSQGVGVVDGRDVGRLLQRRPAQQLLDRDLELLAAQRVRHRGRLDDLVRDVPGGQPGAQGGDDLLLQLVVQRVPSGGDDEQAQPVAVVGLLHADHQRLGDLRHGLEHVVEVAAAQAHALPVERRVRTTVHGDAAVGVHRHPVPVAPHAGPGVEVGLGVALCVRVAPQGHRHRGHGLGDDEVPHSVDHRDAVLVPRRAVHARQSAADAPRSHRGVLVGADERAGDVRPAAGRVDPQVRADVLHDPAVAVRRQRRPADHEMPQPAQVVLLPGRDAGVRRSGHDRGAQKHDVRPGACCDLPDRAFRVAGTSFVQHDARTLGERAQLHVPQRPAGGRIGEHTFSSTQSAVQPGPFRALQRDPALTVDQAFGQPGGARAEQHPQRVGELDLFEDQRFVLGQHFVPRCRALRMRAVAEGVGDMDEPFCSAGSLSRSCATTSLRSITLPFQWYPSAAISTLGSSCARRPMVPSAPKSGEQHAHTAPMAAAARQPITACSVFGR